VASAVLKTIGGRTFAFAKLAAVSGIKLQLAIAKLAGSELAELARIAGKAGMGQDAMLAELGDIVERIAGKAGPDEVIDLMKLVFSRVICDGKPINDIDLTFGDDSLLPWQVFVEGLKVNLGDFLAVARSTGSPPESPTTSP
jgi:hypothetical protein